MGSFFVGSLKIEPGYPQLLRLLLIMKTCYSVIDIQRALNLSRDIWEIMDASDKHFVETRQTTVI